MTNLEIINDASEIISNYSGGELNYRDISMISAAIGIARSYELGKRDAVVHGEWKEEDGIQICSNCGAEHEWDEYRASYCDECGARMDGKEREG